MTDAETLRVDEGGNKQDWTPTGENWTCDKCGQTMVEVQRPYSDIQISVAWFVCRCQKQGFSQSRFVTGNGTSTSPLIEFTWFDAEAIKEAVKDA